MRDCILKVGGSCVQPSLKQLLLCDAARADLIVPERGQAKRRIPQPVLLLDLTTKI